MAAKTSAQDRARDAFADLDTPEKTAFVIEATFSTIGAAIRETGQRLADVINDFDPDAFFRDVTAPPEAEPAKPRRKAAAPKTSTAKKPAAKKAAKKPAAKKTTARKKPASKTAGRTTRKKKDDDA